MKKELFWWTSGISQHRVPMLRELSKMGYAVTLVVDFVLAEERVKLGWLTPELGEIRLLKKLTRKEKIGLIQSQNSGAVNIISGLHGCQDAKLIVQRSWRSGVPTGIVSEDWDTRGVKGKIKQVLYWLESFIWNKRIDFILAMGNRGVDAYVKAGYSKNKIERFFYVVDAPQLDTEEEENERFMRFVFVGALCHRKAVDLLLRALSLLKAWDWCLEIVGIGELEPDLKLMALREGIHERITWNGVLSNDKVPGLLSKCDVLVLPSRRDGWGAVVNEALHQGARVVCSSECGASCVLPERSMVFTSEDVFDLAKKLEGQLTMGKVSPVERKETIAYAEHHISPRAAAKLLRDTIECFRGKCALGVS